jgi:raffinose/stachyose/melibiose transport system permease protein
MTETPQPAAPAREESGRRLNPLATIAIFGALVALAGVVIVPIYATALGGFKELGELRSNLLGLPQHWVWSNYWDILVSVRYWRVLGNSLLIALLTVALTLALSSMAAFAFAHLRFFGGEFLLSYLLLGLLFPAATAILPLFIKIRDLGLHPAGDPDVPDGAEIHRRGPHGRRSQGMRALRTILRGASARRN